MISSFFIFQHISMRLYFLSIFLLVHSIILAQDCNNSIHKGEGTYYDSIAGTSSGNCSLPIPSTDLMYAALNTADYDGSNACGACISVTGPSGKVTLRVVDRCPECKEGDVDMTEFAFSRIAAVIDGRVPISWKYVPCALQQKNIKINFKEGSSPYWTAIQFRDIEFGIVTMEYKTNEGSWKLVNRVLFNFFIEESGIRSPMDLRVTSANGESLIFENVPIDLSKDYDTGKQFTIKDSCNNDQLSTKSFKENSKTVIYPNPASSFFHIETTRPLTYTLYDTKGILVRTGTVTTTNKTVLVKDLTRGMYYLKINKSITPIILR